MSGIFHNIHKKITQSFNLLRQAILKTSQYDIARPIVLVDPKYIDGNKIEISDEINAVLGDAVKDVFPVAATPETISRFSLTKDQERRLKAGEQVLALFHSTPHREKRSSGGQSLDEIETLTKRGLAVTVYVVVERLLKLQAYRDKRTYNSKEDHRDTILNELAELWPNPAGENKNFDDHKTRLRTLLSEGRRSVTWKTLFCCNNLKEEIKAWATRFEESTKERLNQEIRFHQSLVTSLAHCEIRSEKVRQVICDISDKVAKTREETKEDRAHLAGTHSAHQCTYADLLPAAFAGNINPADLFPKMEISWEYFETMRLIGRLHRGQRAEFSLGHLGFISPGLKNLLNWKQNSWPELTNDDKELAFWAKAMERVMTADKWHQFLSQVFDHVKEGGTCEIGMRKI